MCAIQLTGVFVSKVTWFVTDLFSVIKSDLPIPILYMKSPPIPTKSLVMTFHPLLL